MLARRADEPLRRATGEAGPRSEPALDWRRLLVCVGRLCPKDEANVMDARDERKVVTLPARSSAVAKTHNLGTGKLKPESIGDGPSVEWQGVIAPASCNIADKNC